MTVLILLIIGSFFSGIFTSALLKHIIMVYKRRRFKQPNLTFNELKNKWEIFDQCNFECTRCQQEVIWLIREIEKYKSIMEKIYNNQITLCYKKGFNKNGVYSSSSSSNS